MKTKSNYSKYQMGWIGIRSSRIGRAAHLLKNARWMKLGHADLNNRNGFDWVRPVATRDEFVHMNWTPFANAGLVGIAAWFSDAQWGSNSALTDKQWSDRATIEAH